MTWDPINDPVDFVLLAGRRSPGIATISGASSARKWDKRRPYAMSKAFLVFRGVDVASFTLTLRLYTEQDWIDWADWRSLLKEPKTGRRGAASFFRRPRGMDIWHPFLEQLGIKSVVVEEVSQPEQTADGEWTISIKLIENSRPQFQLGKAEGSEEKEDDPWAQRIDANNQILRAQNQALARLEDS